MNQLVVGFATVERARCTLKGLVTTASRQLRGDKPLERNHRHSLMKINNSGDFSTDGLRPIKEVMGLKRASWQGHLG
jgi:hypothetical protein